MKTAQDMVMAAKYLLELLPVVGYFGWWFRLQNFVELLVLLFLLLHHLVLLR